MKGPAVLSIVAVLAVLAVEAAAPSLVRTRPIAPRSAWEQEVVFRVASQRYGKF